MEAVNAGRRAAGAAIAPIRTHGPALAVLAAFLLFVWSPLYPPGKLASHLHGGDALANCYLVNWGQHILWRAPWRYFDLPLFFPQEGMKAHTETNPLMEFATGPLRLSGNPVLCYNAMMLLTALLTAFSAYVIAFALFRHRRAAVVAGAIFGGNGFMTWHLWGHPNVIAPMFVAPALWCLWKARRADSPFWAGGLALSMAAQYLCSLYLGAIASIAIAVAWAADLAIARRTTRARELRIAVFLAAAHALALLAALPYQRMSERLGSTRGLGDATMFSASLGSYVLPSWDTNGPLTLAGSLVAGSVSIQHRLEDAVFAGWLPLAMCVPAVAMLVRRARRRAPDGSDGFVWSLLAASAVCFVLSLGPFLWWGDRPRAVSLPFRFLFDNFPPIHFMRATARFAILPLLFVAIASASLLSRWPLFSVARGWRRFAPAACILAVLALEYRPVSAPALVEMSTSSANALGETANDGMPAPWPIDDRRFLPVAAVDFPATPAGSDGGIFNYRQSKIEAALGLPMQQMLLARYRALGIGRVWVEGDDRVAAISAVPQCRRIADWSDGAVFAISPLPEDLQSALSSAFDNIPERPQLPSAEGPGEGFRPWRPVRWIGCGPGAVEWEEIAPPTAGTPLVCLGMGDRFGAVGSGEPMQEIAGVAVRFRHRQPGLDFVSTSLSWITHEEPDLKSAPHVEAWAHGDDRMQTVTFDLRESPRWRAEHHLAALFLAVPQQTWPGLEIEIDGILAKPATD